MKVPYRDTRIKETVAKLNEAAKSVLDGQEAVTHHQRVVEEHAEKILAELPNKKHYTRRDIIQSMDEMMEPANRLLKANEKTKAAMLTTTSTAVEVMGIAHRLTFDDINRVQQEEAKHVSQSL